MAKKKTKEWATPYTDDEVLHQLINNAENKAQMDYLKRKNHIDDAGVREMALLRSENKFITERLNSKEGQIRELQTQVRQQIESENDKMVLVIDALVDRIEKHVRNSVERY